MQDMMTTETHLTLFVSVLVDQNDIKWMFDTSAHEKVFDHKHVVSLNVIEHKVCGIAYIWKCASFMPDMMST